jgi:hypothetical protein
MAMEKIEEQLKALFYVEKSGVSMLPSFLKGKDISATRMVRTLPESCDGFVWAQQFPVIQ